MKKRFVCFLTLIAVLTISLCACSLFGPGNNPTPDDGGKINENKDGWTKIESPNMTDVYTKFLGSFTSVVNEFSKTKLKSSPKVSADGQFKVNFNGSVFWGFLRLNYNNEKPKDAMLSFELATDDVESTNNVFGLYLYNEKVYVNFAETTKFSVYLPAEEWAPYFPLEYNSVSLDKVAALLAMNIAQTGDAVGKSRMNGLVEEYNFVINIDLAKTLKNILSLDVSYETIDNYANIVASLCGVTLDEIKAGKFPTSTLKLDFTTSNMKLAALKIDLDVKDIANKNTLFGDDNLKCNLELEKLQIGKQNVSVPFVWDENADNREKYVYYRDNAFKLSFDSAITMPDKTVKDYFVDIKAKVLQENHIDNYVFIELKDAKTLAPQEGLYVYKDIAYLYSREGDNYVCKLRMHLDLSEVALRTMHNDFGLEEKHEMDWLALISYAFKNLHIGKNAVEFSFDGDFYKYVWINLCDMLQYIDNLYAENLFSEVEPLQRFVEIVTEYPADVKFDYDEAFISMVTEDSEEINFIVSKLATAEPELELFETEEGTVNE